MKTAKSIVAVCCVLSLGWFAVFTLHWPFAGDSTLMHYVVFLTRHGMAPYRDIIELNTPCAYLVERGAMAVYGESALGWRLFDFTLLAVTGLCYISILRPRYWEAGLFAAALFATIHGQDGVMMQGQRDLQVAVFQIAALACLLRGLRTEPPTPRAPVRLFAFGLLGSLAVCVKPPAIFFLAAIIAWVILRPADRKVSLRAFLLPTLAGTAIPVLVSAFYIEHYHAFFDFWTTWRSLVAYHAQLDRKPLSFLLSHSLSPVMALFALYVILLMLQRRRTQTLADSLLAVSAVTGWLSYAIQGKGFPYQRYPFLIFLVPLMASAIFAAFKSSFAAQWIARAALVTGVVLILLFARRSGTYSQANPYKQMSEDLKTFGGNNPSGSLSGSVQCMDTIGGCIATLYENQLVQSTGNFYDCYLMDEQNPLAQDLRKRFEDQLLPNPPRAIIITDSACYGEKRRFDKFSTWPAFTNLLADRYQLVTERNFTTPVRYWTRGEIPFDYRIYVRR